MLAFWRKREFDLDDFTRRQLVSMQGLVSQFKLEDFKNVEPLFCEIFWNRVRRVRVDFVPEAYVRHLLRRRLSDYVSDELDHNAAWKKTSELHKAAVAIGYIRDATRNYLFIGEEHGFALTQEGAIYLERKFSPAPWYIRLMDMIAESWHLFIIGAIAGAVALYDFFDKVLPWFVHGVAPWFKSL